MPYFPKVGKAYRGPLAYFCERCEQWYKATEKQCPVVHAKGMCCHTGEVLTLSPQPKIRTAKNEEESCPTFQ